MPVAFVEGQSADQQKSKMPNYLLDEAKNYMIAVEETKLIEGFESSFGIELLATVDWLIYKDGYIENIFSKPKS